mmetsp:Transcript_3279/g.8107  ORF Transcript_3279/g.8107 Transcript_3279/m.8107 type:complete len:85 (+) Transcript_3279:370-624(+)
MWGSMLQGELDGQKELRPAAQGSQASPPGGGGARRCQTHLSIAQRAPTKRKREANGTAGLAEKIPSAFNFQLQRAVFYITYKSL